MLITGEMRAAGLRDVRTARLDRSQFSICAIRRLAQALRLGRAPPACAARIELLDRRRASGRGPASAHDDARRPAR